MQPQNYAERIPYRPPARWYRRINRLGVLLASHGLAPRGVVALEVRGRTSGRTRRAPVLVTRNSGHDYIVALAGESQWVHNVRADQGRAALRRRGVRAVLLEELPAEGRGEVMIQYLHDAERRGGHHARHRQEQSYFGVPVDASTQEIAAVVEHYPVFRIEYRDLPRQ